MKLAILYPCKSTSFNYTNAIEKISLCQVREMAQYLRALDSLLDKPGSSPSTHVAIHNMCNSSPRKL